MVLLIKYHVQSLDDDRQHILQYHHAWKESSESKYENLNSGILDEYTKDSFFNQVETQKQFFISNEWFKVKLILINQIRSLSKQDTVRLYGLTWLVCEGLNESKGVREFDYILLRTSKAGKGEEEDEEETGKDNKKNCLCADDQMDMVQKTRDEIWSMKEGE